ncbi:thiol-disulfide isomerase-like thioredoxin [Xylanibacter oryzae DSM 17970]|uniref:Thiol-disulfide isomerase-like thioredoxin n=1 Tax=Xylanibacter oryzae DSM 17970 TaxID=915438 RepID=A0ABP3BDA9_9BACT|nr:TlpA disulfide reductase family protein [Xylanibacter oryzae]EXG77673.1 thiol-disulfide isomerase-like thioredoxin [Xylanibacter oryzae DSM 17970]
MKNKILKTIMPFALTAMALCVSFNSFAGKTFKIDGTVLRGLHDVKYYIYIGDSNGSISSTPTDSVDVKNGKFSYSVNLDDIREGRIQAVLDDGTICTAYMQFPFLPGEKANLLVCNGEFRLSGSSFYKQWGAFDDFYTPYQKSIELKRNKAMNAWQKLPKDENKVSEKDKEAFTLLNNEYRDEINKTNTAVQEYLKKHNNEEGCIMYMARYFDDVEGTWNAASESVKKGRIANLLKKKVEQERLMKEHQEKIKAVEKQTGEGVMFKDFTVEYEGKTQKLSDYVGKGKYVLVDFWASWCGPCRGEIPNIINVYNKYKGDKFEVLGVATWDKPEDTKKAIQELGIAYPQIYNAQNVGSDAYGISGIPEIILFGPDGKILKRGLRGEMIGDTVKQYLSE